MSLKALKILFKEYCPSRHRWFTPVIIATQEVEIRIVV
jgi:hypothetical protein